MAGERPHRLRQEVDAGARRNIIEHERQGRRVRDRGLVRKQACLRPFIIVGRDGQQRIRAVLCRKILLRPKKIFVLVYEAFGLSEIFSRANKFPAEF